ncbi:hypothetical protein Bca101_003891 [Brassica carinata]
MEATGGIWGEVERSESYLVCSMYEEAESLSSSILKQTLGNIDVLSEEALGDHQLFHDMLESAGMVLVQSLPGVDSPGEIVNELRQVFGEVAAIPLQVLLTGKEFDTALPAYSNHGLRKLHCLRKHDRRLHSLLSLKSANVPEATSFEENSSYDVVNNNKSLANDEVDYVLKLSKQHEPWSSRPLSLRLGNTRFSISRGKVALSLVGLIICYALKRKRAGLIRIIRRQMESTKRVIVDFWKLAFSYQVNPLAAIQSIPSTTT